MTKRIHFLTAFLAATLTAATAWPCSPMIPNSVVPHPWGGQEVPVGGSLLVRVGEVDFSLPELLDPEGEAVEWELEESDFDESVLEARPVGDWLLGSYVHDPFDPEVEAEDMDVAYEIVDSVDEEPPVVSIASWTGQSESLPMPFSCGGNWSYGVSLSMEPAGEPVLYRYEVTDGASTSPTGLSFDEAWMFVPGEAGSRLSVRVEAVDLSGNVASDSVEEAISCEGCSGSVAGEPGLGALALLAGLGGLLGRRRRD